MPGSTARLGLYLPGGGASGVYVPDEVADIDQVNNNFIALDGALGAPDTLSTGRPGSPFDGQLAYETDTGNLIRFEQGGSNWQHITEDTGWLPLVPASGVVLASGNVRIINQILYLQGSASRTANWTVGQNVATLPVPLPARITNTIQRIVSFGSGNLGVITIAPTTGTISLSLAQGTTSLTMGMNFEGPIN